MDIINLLSPKPLNPYIRETYEAKMFYVVSESLHRVGIHGDDNTIETCRTLGINDCCDKVSTIRKEV